MSSEDGNSVCCDDDVVVVVTVGNSDCICRKMSHNESALSMMAELDDSCNISEDFEMLEFFISEKWQWYQQRNDQSACDILCVWKEPINTVFSLLSAPVVSITSLVEDM
eukprot:3409905-Ditylum_brightwellii.AAC.1